MHHPSVPRPHPVRRARTGARAALVALGVLAGTVPVGPMAVATTLGSTVEHCPPDAVTVVVDFTGLGGGIESGCAEGADSGTQALIAAGFADTRDPSGFICAIDALPDPCPAEFTGEFWSYWHVVDGQWQSYDVGSDDSVPGPGDVEGWRYGDGTTPPAATVPAASEPEVTSRAKPQDGAADDAATAAVDEASPGLSPAVVAGTGLVAVLLIAAVVLARRRSGASAGDGPTGQDR